MKKELKTIFDYNDGTGIVPDGEFRISASGIADFFSNTRQWWGDNFLGEKSFSGNFATLVGTCVHGSLETFAKTQDISDEIKKELANYILKSTDPTYKDCIEEAIGKQGEADRQFKTMASVAINQYLVHNMPVVVEPFLTHKIHDSGIHIGGSIDALYNGQPMTDNTLESIRGQGNICVVDYKTSSASRLPDTINFKQKLQLLTYAFVLRKEYNIKCDRMRIVYITRDNCGRISEKTGKPLKDYPSETKVITENITQQDMEYIENIVNLIAESVHRWNTVPQDRYLLAHDYRLKNNPTGAIEANTNLFKKE